MTRAVQLFNQALLWLERHYSDYWFYLERDVVWTVQTHLRRRIADLHLPYRVHNHYPIMPGPRRSLSTDLAIVRDESIVRDEGDDIEGDDIERNGERVEVAVEFKYEPSHARNDILPQKLPVVFWNHEGVAKDIQRIRDFVDQGSAQAAYAIFIDEGGYFSHRAAHPGSRWQRWDNGVWVLVAQAGIEP